MTRLRQLLKQYKVVFVPTQAFLGNSEKEVFPQLANKA